MSLVEIVAWMALGQWFKRNPTGIAEPWTPADDATQEFMCAATPQALYEAVRSVYRERCPESLGTIRGALA